MKHPVIVTISRQYGSGGRTVGRLLAEKLGVPFYDKELIELAAKESGLDESVLASADEQVSSSLLYSLSLGMYAGVGRADSMNGLSINDRVYVHQAKVIRDIAQKGPCVIVGRCADSILAGRADVVSVYIHASRETRLRRVVEQYGMDPHRAENELQKIDKRRTAYHDYYADTKWGRAENYQLSLDTSRLSDEGAAAAISTYLEFFDPAANK